MRPGLLKLTLTLAILWLVRPVLADIAVVTHPGSPLEAVSPRQISDLYMGRTHSIGSGEQKIIVVIFEHPNDSPLRETFFRNINGMDIRKVNAYWARLRFSGEVLPPRSLRDSQEVINAIRRTPNAVGYIDAALVDNSVRTLLLLKD